MLSLEILQTNVRQAFDPATISVVVGKIETEEHRFVVTVRDELSQLSHEFKISLSNTIGDLDHLINTAAAELGLVPGPDAVGEETGDEVIAGTIAPSTAAGEAAPSPVTAGDPA